MRLPRGLAQVGALRESRVTMDRGLAVPLSGCGKQAPWPIVRWRMVRSASAGKTWSANARQSTASFSVGGEAWSQTLSDSFD